MGERLVYTQKVVGSSPASPIKIYGIKVLKPVIENRLFLFLKACKNVVDPGKIPEVERELRRRIKREKVVKVITLK